MSLTSLQQNTVLQAQVLKRVNQLIGLDSDEEDQDKEDPLPKQRYLGKRSGRVKTADDRVLKQVDWPHYYIYRAGSASSTKYHDLTAPEFTYGYISQILEGKFDERDCKLKLRHLRDLMQDATDFSWENARNFHGIVLSQMERKRLTWQDTTKLQELRTRYAHNRQHTQNKSGKTTTAATSTTNSVKHEVCRKYNNKRCEQPGDHSNYRGANLLHVCELCWKKDKIPRRHTAGNCWMQFDKEITQSKN